MILDILFDFDNTLYNIINKILKELLRLDYEISYDNNLIIVF